MRFEKILDIFKSRRESLNVTKETLAEVLDAPFQIQ